MGYSARALARMQGARATLARMLGARARVRTRDQFQPRDPLSQYL